jgi:hypothetical protein
MLRTLAILATALTAQSFVQLHAADCAALKQLPIENTTITLAEPVTSGTLTVPDAGVLKGLPAFCRVAGVLRPTSDSVIHFEVWLPAQDWIGRLLGTGNVAALPSADQTPAITPKPATPAGPSVIPKK